MMDKHHNQLDISVGISGPHDFAVRGNLTRLLKLPRPPHPAPNVRDDREAPLFIGHGITAALLLFLPNEKAKYFSS
jgi:hypothetical protein